jgi:hypothetical protein
MPRIQRRQTERTEVATYDVDINRGQRKHGLTPI